MKKEIEAILGLKVVEIESTGAELIEENAQYNSEGTICVERLEDETYYVTKLESDAWETVGYYAEV